MTNQPSTLEKLIAFRELDKFSGSAWNQRGLNPSDSTLCARLEDLFNDCAGNLIEAVKSGGKPGQLKDILKKGLGQFNKADYDTEEREFICDYFFKLSTIVGVDLKDNLNSWLYGTVLSTLIKVIAFIKGPEKIRAVLSQACTNCGTRLDTFILRKEEGIPDYPWTIIQCNNCKEYNLLSPGPNIKELRFGEYSFVEQLSPAEFTEEQAKQRFEQIKYFRRK